MKEFSAEYIENLERKNVLVVDDETDLLQLVASELEAAGYNTYTCPDGEAAIQLSRQVPLSLVISDFRMPRMNGLELFRKIQSKKGIKPHFIFISGFTDLTTMGALDIGADAFLEKPFSLDDLMARVDSLLVPREWNWSLPFSETQTLRKIHLEISSLSEAERAGEFLLGRAGFFISLPENDMPRESENLFFSIQSSDPNEAAINGLGVVRWTRRASDEVRSGAGVEILRLEDESRVYLLSLIESGRLKKTIPANEEA